MATFNLVEASKNFDWDGKRRKVKETLRPYRKYLKIASDILTKLPVASDNTLTKVVKVLAVMDSFDKEFSSDNKLFSFFASLKAEQKTNSHFVDLFFNTPLLTTFEVQRLPLGDYVEIVIATDPDLGSLYFVEYHWGSQNEPSSDFWFSPDFQFEKALARLWDLYGQGIHVSLKNEANRSHPRTSYQSILFPKDPFLGEAKAHFDEFVAKHQRVKDNGFSRVYLFRGKQGVGKSSFAARVAQTCGNRTLMVNTKGMSGLATVDISFMIECLKPDFLIFEDIDYLSDPAAATPLLLDMLVDLKERHSYLTSILTVNSIEPFKPAVLRPGRVDKIITFKDPGPEERGGILKGYLEGFGVPLPDTDLEALVKATEGLTAAYLKEVAIQVKTTDSLSEVLEDIRTMQEILETKEPENKGLQTKAETPTPNKAV